MHNTQQINGKPLTHSDGQSDIRAGKDIDTGEFTILTRDNHLDQTVPAITALAHYHKQRKLAPSGDYTGNFSYQLTTGRIYPFQDITPFE
jgi:hypothetical protein